MPADKLVFDLAMESEGTPSVFVKKDWLSILDDQNGNYNSNQSTISTSQLSNSNKWLSFREGYLYVPMLLTLGTTSLSTAAGFLPATAATSADMAIGLKNWFGNIVHSFSVEYNGVSIIQQTPFCGMYNSFKLMTTLSWDDVKTQGASIGFYPDDALAWTFEAANSTTGVGVCNNTNFGSTVFGGIVTGQFQKYNSGGGNIGLLKRQQFIAYDTAGDSGSGTFAGQLAADQARTLWKSYVSTKVNGVNNTTQGMFQVSISAVIKLKHLHSFFDKVPLLKGAFMKMVLTLNNTTISFTSAGSGGILSALTVSQPVGGVCPIMLASAAASNGSVAAFGAADYRANLSVGARCLDSALVQGGAVGGTLGQSIYLYVPAYAFNPVFEEAMISRPIARVEYEDIYQYQVQGIASLGQVNQLLTNGISGIKSVLILPFYSSDATATGLPAYQSPYDPAGTGPTSPLCLLSNFNVVISGQNAIYNTERYSFEQFMNQTYGAGAINGGMIDGLTSGLIDQLSFEQEYCYYYVDVSRCLPVEESVAKSVQVVAQNMSARKIDLFCFISYKQEIQIDRLSGARV